MTQIEKRQKFLEFRNEMYTFVSEALVKFYDIDYKHDIQNFIFENAAEDSPERDFSKSFATYDANVFNNLSMLLKLLKAENIRNIFPENKEK